MELVVLILSSRFSRSDKTRWKQGGLVSSRSSCRLWGKVSMWPFFIFVTILNKKGKSCAWPCSVGCIFANFFCDSFWDTVPGPGGRCYVFGQIEPSTWKGCFYISCPDFKYPTLTKALNLCNWTAGLNQPVLDDWSVLGRVKVQDWDVCDKELIVCTGLHRSAQDMTSCRDIGQDRPWDLGRP